MDIDKAKADYKIFEPDYASFQEEVFILCEDLFDVRKSVIHIVDIKQRPQNNIKNFSSIEENINNPEKYIGYKDILSIKDISGIRIICHCEDDVENAATLLEGELSQEYLNVSREEKGGENNTGKSKPPYRAVHLSFSKKIDKEGNKFEIFSEIQIRTVMADAWAIQDRKYIYGKAVKGEAQELTNAVSEIMKGCEKLWSLVKKKSPSQDTKEVIETLETIQKSASVSLGSTKTLAEDKKLIKWFLNNRQKASEGLTALELQTFLEIKVVPPDIGLNIPKSELKDKARESTIRTFGWPIGIFIEGRPEFAPKVDIDGIHTEVSVKGANWDGGERITYDYWSLNSNGAFYLLKSLFENERKPDSIFFDTRIVRITETLLYIRNLYTKFEVPQNAKISITIKHSGLKGKMLTSASPNRFLPWNYTIDTNEVESSVTTTLSEINSNITDIVEKFTEPLFVQFNFFKLDKKVLTDIVTNFVNGKIV